MNSVHHVLLVGSVLLAACAGSDTDVSGTAGDPTAPVTVDDGDVFTEADGEPSADDADPGVVVSFDPVPETGVPGIDSDDLFCRSWSEYAGSVQALSLAWAVLAPVDAARLEIAAGDALRNAVVGLASALPPELEGNRQAFTTDVPAPMLARATRSSAYLDEAGAAGQSGALAVLWIEALSATGLGEDAVALDVPADIAVALDAAAERFAADVPSINEDPTLDTTAFDIAPSLAYISDNCPDQGTLAGDDNVGGP